MGLTDKVAVATCGSGGLGQRISHALTCEGCRIAIVYAASAETAQKFGI